MLNKMKIRLSESDIKSIVMRSVESYLRESTDNMNLAERWQNIKETLGCDKFLEEIFEELSHDEIERIVDNIERVGFMDN